MHQEKYSANVWAVSYQASLFDIKRITDVEKPRITKTIVDINLFLFICRYYLITTNKTHILYIYAIKIKIDKLWRTNE